MGTILIPPEGKPVTCAECGMVITRDDVKSDKTRLYKRRGSYLCELCAEDEIEDERDDDHCI